MTPSLHKSKLPKAELIYGETQHTAEGQLSRDGTELQGREGERRGEKGREGERRGEKSAAYK